MFQTHAVVGYLLGMLSRLPTAYAVAGSVMPDLLDRPLAWSDAVDHEHSIGHSLLLAVPASLLATRFFGRRGTAFAIAWLIHILGDILNVTTGEGPRIAPSYVLYPLTREGSGEKFSIIRVKLPGTNISHTLNPVMFVLELALTSWALLVATRQFDLVGRVRHYR